MKAQRCVLDNSGSGHITSKGELLYLKACKSIGKGSSGHCHHQEDPYLLPSNFHQQTNELIERSSSALARFAGAVAVLNSLRRLSFAARKPKANKDQPKLSECAIWIAQLIKPTCPAASSSGSHCRWLQQPTGQPWPAVPLEHL